MKLDTKGEYGFSDKHITDSDKLSIWDRFRFDKIRSIYQTSDTLIDFGKSARGLDVLFKNELKGKKITIDINEQVKPDIVADICNLHMFENECIDGIICASVLECVYDPFKAVSELYRILKPTGTLFVYVPWICQYQGWPEGGLSDYYRFSSDGVKYLFKEFSFIEICPVMGYVETILYLINKRGTRSIPYRLLSRLIRNIDRYNERFCCGFNILLNKSS